jgi:DSHCT (NUC185) domain
MPHGTLRGNIYYEYVKIYPHQVGRIFSELVEVKTHLGLNKNGVLEERALEAISRGFFNIRNLTDWKLQNSCNLFVHERGEYFKKMQNLGDGIIHKCRNKNSHLEQWLCLERFQKEYDFNRSLMTSTSREKMDDFNAKVKVLVNYGYLDSQMNMLFKGKVAHEIISTDKIITTELIFSGLLKDLTIEECIALFSVLYT